MNDREQGRLLGNLTFAGIYAIMGFLSAAMIYLSEPLGLGTVMYGLTTVMCAAVSIACLLLVRQQMTRWEPAESKIEQLRSLSRNYILIPISMGNYHVVPDHWQPIVAVIIALAAAFATIWLLRSLSEITWGTPTGHSAQ